MAAASGPAKARRSSASPSGSMASISRSTSAATTSVKRSRDGLQAKRARERRAVALVLVAVEREHARADDAPGREARVVDREGGRVAHDLQREVAAQDEPAAEGRQPHHGRALAQAGEQGMSVRAPPGPRR